MTRLCDRFHIATLSPAQRSINLFSVLDLDGLGLSASLPVDSNFRCIMHHWRLGGFCAILARLGRERLLFVFFSVLWLCLFSRNTFTVFP